MIYRGRIADRTVARAARYVPTTERAAGAITGQGRMATYKIIEARHPPGPSVWWCLWREELTDGTSPTEISRHATKQQAEVAKARREQQDAERGA
jgi:hypothetical protein